MGFILHDLLTGKGPEDEDEPAASPDTEAPQNDGAVAKPKSEERKPEAQVPSPEAGKTNDVTLEEASRVVEVTETESVL